MRSYPALITISTIIKICSGLIAIGGIIVGFTVVNKESTLGILIIIGVAYHSLLILALAEIIAVFAYLGEDVSWLREQLASTTPKKTVIIGENDEGDGLQDEEIEKLLENDEERK